MALEFAHGALQWTTSLALNDTSLAVSGLSFQPKALRFYWVGIQSSTDATSTSVSSMWGVGFATGTSSRRACAGTSINGAGNANCGSVATDSAVVITCTSSTVDGRLDLNALNSDGFSLIVDDVAVQNITVFWEVWGGSDITVATVGDITEPAATGNQDYTVTGFVSGATDQVVMFAGVQSASALGTAENQDSGLHVGFASSGAAADNVTICGNSDDGSATMETNRYSQDGECLSMIAIGGGTTVNARAQLTQFGTNNFRLNWIARATTGRRSIFLAIKGGNWKSGFFLTDIDTVGNTSSVSGLAFAPIGVSMIAVNAGDFGTAGTGTTIGQMGLGTASSTSSRRCLSVLDENGTANAEIDTLVEYDQILAFQDNNGAIENATDIDAMFGDGFRVIVDDAVAGFQWQGYLTFGSAVGGPVTITRTIGSSGNFSTLQLWEDAMGTDHTTAEKSAAGTFLVAAFQQGESLTFTGSGATGKLLDTDSTGAGTGTYVTYAITAGNPATSDVCTGGTSLATCVISNGTPMNIGVAWTGQCQNQEFTGANPLLTLSGTTTSTTTPVTLTTASGASFADNANELTNALRYNASNGAAINGTSVNGRTVEVTTDNVTISKLQIANTTTQGSSTQAVGIQTSGANARFIDCIFEGSGTAATTGGGVLRTAASSVTNNCLIILRGATACDRIVPSSTNTFRGCTIVASDDLATAPTSIFNTTGATVIQNCGIFAGDSTKAIVAGGGSVSATTCYSDISGTSGVTQTTMSAAFENVNDATRDYRLKTGSALLDTGTTDASNTPNDIVGTARPVGSAYDVGAWEFTPIGGAHRLLLLGVGI